MTKFITTALCLALTIQVPSFGATIKEAIIEKLKVATIFSDNMVLQRNKDIAIWGWSKAGEKITIEFAGKKASTIVNAKGKWLLKFPKLDTNCNGQKMVISGCDSKVLFKNILIGEVWVCSGQSNMEWPLHRRVKGAVEAIKQANYPKMRLFNLGRKVSITPEADCKGRWVVCTPKTVGSFSATAFFFGRKLNKELKNVPIGLIKTAWGGTPAEAWTNLDYLENIDPLKENIATLKKKIADDKLKKVNQHTPSSLYNGMIYPLVPLAIRGAIWYQGENNSKNAPPYRKIFPAMVKGWRKDFAQGDFPFYYVQIAPFKYGKNRDGVGIREIQRECLKLIPNSGMACIMDKATLGNIHPPYKTEVGNRLAYWALAKDYGKEIKFSGPLFKEIKIEDNKVIVSFDYAQGLTSKDKKISSFELKDDTGKWHKASAVIKDECIVVSSTSVQKPMAVRYAWSNTAIAELWNDANLPASSFRSDKW